jgi:hypothetical protein
MATDIGVLQHGNIVKAIKDGPRLRYDYSLFCVARDRARKRVLVGGLGGLGVGQEWFEEAGHAHYPGYEDAPERDSWMGFGTPEWRKGVGG